VQNSSRDACEVWISVRSPNPKKTDVHFGPPLHTCSSTNSCGGLTKLDLHAWCRNHIQTASVEPGHIASPCKSHISRVKRVQSPVLSFHCDRTRSSRNSLCFPYPKTLDLTQNFLGLWVQPPESNRFTRDVLLVSHGVTYPPSPEAQHRSHSTTEVPGNTMERDVMRHEM
jgi:hypothetical protein